MKGDPVGLLIGRQGGDDICSVGVCLDVTSSAVVKARARKCNLIVAHHPLIYRPLARLADPSDPISNIAADLVRSNIALYVLHTNLDRARSGINDVLAELLGLEETLPLGESDIESIIRVGNLVIPCTARDFIRSVDRALACTGTSAIRFSDGDGNKMISRVAVCGGAGGPYVTSVLEANVDAYVTSDVKHHEFVDAAERNVLLVDAGHSATETPGMRALVKTLKSAHPDAEIIWIGPGD